MSARIASATAIIRRFHVYDPLPTCDRSPHITLDRVAPIRRRYGYRFRVSLPPQPGRRKAPIRLE